VNRPALSRAVRSLYFRRQLATAIPTLEGAIREELASRRLATALIAGFLVRVDDKVLSIEPAPPVHSGQQRLPDVR